MDERLYELIISCEKIIDCDAYREVMHFYIHGEFEMSLEGLLIELIKYDRKTITFSLSQIKELCLYYGIDKESVFDYYIWEKFCKWCNQP